MAGELTEEPTNSSQGRERVQGLHQGMWDHLDSSTVMGKNAKVMLSEEVKAADS